MLKNQFQIKSNECIVLETKQKQIKWLFWEILQK